jgi:hypothetical protein
VDGEERHTALERVPGFVLVLADAAVLKEAQELVEQARYISFRLNLMLASASRWEMRVVSSRAALSVKVTTNNDSGSTPLCVMRWTMRSTSVKVLPEPGPAMMSTGPSAARMASSCCGLALD